MQLLDPIFGTALAGYCRCKGVVLCCEENREKEEDEKRRGGGGGIYVHRHGEIRGQIAFPQCAFAVLKLRIVGLPLGAVCRLYVCTYVCAYVCITARVAFAGTVRSNRCVGAT